MNVGTWIFLGLLAVPVLFLLSAFVCSFFGEPELRCVCGHWPFEHPGHAATCNQPVKYRNAAGQTCQKVCDCRGYKAAEPPAGPAPLTPAEDDLVRALDPLADVCGVVGHPLVKHDCAMVTGRRARRSRRAGA